MLSVFSKINEKLNQGWKLTNTNCPICNTTVLGNLQTKEFRCVKCDMPVKLEFEETEEEPNFEVIDSKKEAPVEEIAYENPLFSKEREERRKRDNENSKKMGELLLGGWAMLAESCMNCYQPYMKSKKGEVVCVGCGPVVQKEEPPLEIEKPKENNVVPSLEKTKEPERKAPVIEETKRVEQPLQKEIKKASPVKSVNKPSESFERIEAPEPLADTRTDPRELFELMQFEQSISFYSRVSGVLGVELERIRRDGLDGNVEKLENLLSLQKSLDANKINILNQLRGSQK